ncbi:hypothetical protein FRC12_002627 [Ceratobasidium sp. 428]|nr:hypothetical protein FRC12_002627 [Ceratobasidium sp. 428]
MSLCSASDGQTGYAQHEPREQIPKNQPENGTHSPILTDSSTDSDDDYSDSDSDINIFLRPLEPGETLVDHSGPTDDDQAISRGKITFNTATPKPPMSVPPPVPPPVAETLAPRHRVNHTVVAAVGRPGDRQ